MYSLEKEGRSKNKNERITQLNGKYTCTDEPIVRGWDRKRNRFNKYFCAPFFPGAVYVSHAPSLSLRILYYALLLSMKMEKLWIITNCERFFLFMFHNAFHCLGKRWWNGPRLELEIFTVLFLFVLCVCTTKRNTKESLTHSKWTNRNKKTKSTAMREKMKCNSNEIKREKQSNRQTTEQHYSKIGKLVP